jgi:hypothetical protein
VTDLVLLRAWSCPSPAASRVDGEGLLDRLSWDPFRDRLRVLLGSDLPRRLFGLRPPRLLLPMAWGITRDGLQRTSRCRTDSVNRAPLPRQSLIGPWGMLQAAGGPFLDLAFEPNVIPVAPYNNVKGRLTTVLTVHVK